MKTQYLNLNDHSPREDFQLIQPMNGDEDSLKKSAQTQNNKKIPPRMGMLAR